MAKKVQIPLKEMLSALDNNDFDFYTRLSDEEKKVFSPWLAMRYASAAQGNLSSHYLLMVNDIVNVNFSSLTAHPDLQWKLLAVCGAGSNAFHPWIPPSKKKAKNKIQEFLTERYPHLKRDEIELLQEINNADELRDLARDYGLDEKQVSEIFGK
mgnify:CR=1 FL=1|jgi:hypothetical protein